MAKTETAILAAGCFWGVQAYFDEVPGVVNTTVGYTGGHTDSPTYEDVCYRDTGHAEAVMIEFDPSQVSYETLLKHFFRMHDPTQYMRQGPDVGSQYRSAIFFTKPEQEAAAKAAIADLEHAKTFDQPVVTEVVEASPFYEAEEYHQKFTEKTGRGACHVPYAPV